MNRFKNIIIDRSGNFFKNMEYLSRVMFLHMRNEKYMDDDYAYNGESFFEHFIDLVERVCPFFWVIIDGDNVSGFVYLDNVIGNSKSLHSAELVTCFDRAYWGKYTKICAKLFIDYCFETFGFIKIKALIYPQNFRVKAILKESGFEKEGVLKSETKKNGILQDIEIFSIFNKEKKGKI